MFEESFINIPFFCCVNCFVLAVNKPCAWTCILS